MIKEYTQISSIVGPLILVEGIDNVSYGEVAEVKLSNGDYRRGQVLEVSKDKCLVQIFEGTSGFNLNGSKIHFQGRGIEIGVSEDMLGRIFDGLGRPIDGGKELIPEKKIDVNGLPINPSRRNYPSEFIQTGISAIDAMVTLVRGQKLPIFSGSGMVHNEIAAQIARQAKVHGKDDKFAVVFGAMGITFEESDYFIKELTKTGAISRSVMYINLSDDPAIERIATPRLTLATAEYLAFEKGMHVLVILTDMTNYCEALRQISAARKEIPGRRGYPGYMYTDLSNIYERAGRILGNNGSITMIPILTMPEDDKTHPIPDLTGYITEGQVIISRDLMRRGINPSIDVLPSLSRLKEKGIGDGKTREDHAQMTSQLFGSYARGKEAKELAIVLGEAALTDTDKIYARFADEFESKFINQGIYEDRNIDETLDLGWKLLSILPIQELKRIKDNFIDKYLKRESK